MLTEKLKKTHFKYCCEKCDYSCSKKGDFNIHLNTLKHINTSNVDKC